MDWKKLIPRANWIVLLGLAITCQLSSALYSQDEDAVPDALRERLQRLWDDQAPDSLGQGRPEDAEKLYLQLRETDPENPDYIAGLGMALARQKRIDEALDLLVPASKEFPRHAGIGSARGQAYFFARKTKSAMRWLERAESLNYNEEDVGLFLGSSYLRCELPMLALDRLWCSPTGGQAMDWNQDLAIGAAYAQLGLQCEAAGYFNKIKRRGTPQFQAEARSMHRRMNHQWFSRDYLRASVEVAQRYDNNPAVFPATNLAGTFVAGRPSAGNVIRADVEYDILREYNREWTVGSSVYHTTNYRIHAFDIVDSAAFINFRRRELWCCTPHVLNTRFEVDHFTLGSEDFLTRGRLTPMITRVQNDWESLTVLGRITQFDFQGQGTLNNSPFDQDGTNLTAGIYKEYKCLPCRNLVVLMGYEYDHQFSQGSNFDFTGHKARLGVDWKDLPFCLTLRTQAGIYWRNYDHNHSTAGVKRDDEEYYGSVALIKRMCDTWDVKVQYLWDRNDSNVGANDYRRHVLDVSATYYLPYGRTDRDLPYLH